MYLDWFVVRRWGLYFDRADTYHDFFLFFIFFFSNRCFLRLEAPIQRLCSYDTPFPLVFEKFHVPDMIRCAEGIERAMKF
jgi:pyruvate/2-oxoglutarate/acetoin dehydrogenase E1 component